MLGLFFSHLGDDSDGLNMAYCVLSLLPLMIIPFGSLRSVNQYLEHIGHSNENSNAGTMLSFLKYTNPVRGLSMFLIWVAFAIASTFLSEIYFLSIALVILVQFTFYAFFWCLLELFVLHLPSNSKIGFLLGFIAILHAFLPLVIAGIFGIDELVTFSPFGYLGVWADLSGNDALWGESIKALIVNLILSVVPVMIIAKKYRYLMKMRESME